MDPSGTVQAWKNSIKSYPDSSVKAYEDALKLVNGPVEATKQIWTNIQAQRVSIDEVPASARAALGDEVALNVAKNLVRNGKDAGAIKDLKPEDVAAIQSFAKRFADFAKLQESCDAKGGCASNDSQKKPLSRAWYTDTDGTLKWRMVEDVRVDTPGRKLLQETARLQTYLDGLPIEQAQLLGLGIQAVMGPAKMAVGLAGNVVVDKLFGDKIAAAKDSISKSIASELSDKDKADLEISDNLFKIRHEQGRDKQSGDVYVRGATTLLNIALGTVTNAAGAATGKVIGIVGKGSSDGITKGTDGLEIDPKHPDWAKEFGETPSKGWLEAGPKNNQSLETPDGSKSNVGGSTAEQNASYPIVKVDTSQSVKGSPTYEILNNPNARSPNTRYELDNGDAFVTNSHGMVEELTFTPANVKVPRDSRQTAAGKEGRETDVGGHAQACSQGGTCDGYNLFPQDQNFNNSAYKVFYEHRIKEALNDPSKTVGPTTIKFRRDDPASARPDAIQLTYTVDGKAKTLIFKNEANELPEVL
jgi:filamentous hemagglutinin